MQDAQPAAGQGAAPAPTEGRDEAVLCEPCRQQACLTAVAVTQLGQSSALGTESTFADSMNLRGVSVRGTGPGRLGEARRGPEPGRDPSLGPDSISAVTFSSQVRRSPGGQLLSASAWVTPSPLWDSRPSLHQGGSPTPMLLLCDPLCGGGERRGGAGQGASCVIITLIAPRVPPLSFRGTFSFPRLPPHPTPVPGTAGETAAQGGRADRSQGGHPGYSLPPTRCSLL